MTKFCFRCGNKLLITTRDKYFCSNCGMLKENQNNEEEASEEKEPKYVGVA